MVHSSRELNRTRLRLFVVVHVIVIGTLCWPRDLSATTGRTECYPMTSAKNGIIFQPSVNHDVASIIFKRCIHKIRPNQGLDRLALDNVSGDQRRLARNLDGWYHRSEIDFCPVDETKRRELVVLFNEICGYYSMYTASGSFPCVRQPKYRSEGFVEVRDICN